MTVVANAAGQGLDLKQGLKRGLDGGRWVKIRLSFVFC